MKSAIALLAVLAAVALITLALLQAVRGLGAVRRRDPGSAADEEPLRALRDERRRLLQHLREIEFDHETGKIDEADYRALRERYEREALAVMAALDRAKAAGEHAFDDAEPTDGRPA